MAQQSIYYVGTIDEVAHHAHPISSSFDVKIATPEEVLQHAKAGDLAIFFSEHFRRFRDTIRALNDRRVATLYAIDGILEWRNAWENRSDEPASPFTMRPVLSHKVATIGDSQTRILNAWGNRGKTETVGLPRLDRLRGNSPRPTDDRFRVLIVSAKWPGFTSAQMDHARRAFRDLRAWFEKNPEMQGRRVEATWRLTQGLADEVGVDNALRDITGTDMATALSETDALITTPSTAMLEGMLQGVPVAVLDYNSCPHYIPSAWEMFSGQHMDRVLPELVSPPAPKLAWQQQILHESLACSTPATPRLEDVIRRMLQIAAECVNEDRALSFPPCLLDLPEPLESNPCQFDHANIYPDASEFQVQELKETQISLADARRLIEQLDAENAQLRKDLANCREIFDQIHRHPIAGPVVRVRQRIIDWLSRRREDTVEGSVEPSVSSRDGRAT